MKKWTKNLSTVVTGFIMLLAVSNASALVIEFDYNDTVVVGETFSVDVLVDIGTGQELTSFGFDLASLTNHVSFLGFVLPLGIDAGFFNDVDGFADPFAAIISGDNSLLATLNFSADVIGADVISVLGDDTNFGGLFLLDNGSPIDNFIDTSFAVNVVDNIPTVSAPSAVLLLFLSSLVLFFRRQS